MKRGRLICSRYLVFLLVLLTGVAADAPAAAVFVRVRVAEPMGERLHVTISGYRHADPWRLPSEKLDCDAGAWSEWKDLTTWPWDKRFDRAGGIAEWPAMSVAISRAKGAAIKGCAIEVQLAEKADEAAVVHSFVEKSESNQIAFLVPTPLREHKDEFETGSQMTARQLAWAKEASGGNPAHLKDFTFITALWGHYDPGLARQAVETLKLLGFNVIGNCDPAILQAAGMRTYNTTWLDHADPAQSDEQWAMYRAAIAKNASSNKHSRFATAEATHYVIGDEVQTLNFSGIDVVKLNGWFRDYLSEHHVTSADLGKPLDQIEYPIKAMLAKTLPRDASMPTRKLMYYAAKFGQFWSAKALRHSSDLIRGTFTGMKTETLPSDHGFFYAWGPPHIGMSYRMLDLFELGSQRSVDQLSAEDWLGLNHMYGPQYTWTGAQSFEYFSAICRSATDRAPTNDPMMLRGLITVSDDAYLRLKAYSALGQGAKSLFFWTFGPTYIGTENYWSDLRSEYDGIAKLGRAIEKVEPVLMATKPLRDRVAILYCVSHDIWHSDDPTAFVEKRLLWHALRHLHVQPDFVREEDVEAGKLDGYAALFVTDWCVSRAASAKIDAWTKAGGVVYLSAGAATRDEFYEPFVPPFAATVWPDDAAKTLVHESHTYNERVDLPTIKPLTTAKLANGVELPVLGCRASLHDGLANVTARFADQKPAAATVDYGKGKVIGVAFLPMLAYGQGAHFAPTTLSEKWPGAPRTLIESVLNEAHVEPVARCDVPVVETNLLTGEKGSAVVLVNYTYQPIKSLTVDLSLSQPVTRATSAEGVDVRMEKTPTGVRLHLPLAWTDIVTLQ